MQKLLFFLVLGVLAPLPITGQVQPKRLVTQQVDENQLITLRGTVDPLAQARYDRGAVNESTPAERLVLVLNRPPDEEAAFQQLLTNLHTPGSRKLSPLADADADWHSLRSC